MKVTRNTTKQKIVRVCLRKYREIRLISIGILLGMFITISNGMEKVVKEVGIELESIELVHLIDSVKENFSQIVSFRHIFKKKKPLMIKEKNDSMILHEIDAEPPTIFKEERKEKFDSIIMSDTSNVFMEYRDICEFMIEIWSNYPDREVQGFITNQDKIIVTAIGNERSVQGPHPIIYQDQYYLAWPRKQPLIFYYEDIIDGGGSPYLFIPIRAMFHTHVISGSLSIQDQHVAANVKNLRHLVFEKNRVVEYNEKGVKKMVVGNFIKLCKFLKK